MPLFRNREELARWRARRDRELFDWKLPPANDLSEETDGTIALKPLESRSGSFQAYAMPSFQAEWLNTHETLTDASPKQMIEKIGFLRNGQRDSPSQWVEMKELLNHARVLWLQPKMSKAKAEHLQFSPEESSLQRAIELIRNAVKESIAEGGISSQVLDDLSVMTRPIDLKGFLLLDVAEAIRERPSYRRCNRCKLWFRPDDSRARAYCSLTCRKAENNANYTQRRRKSTASSEG